MTVLASLLTYLVQSSLLLGGAWLVARLLRRHVDIQETVWRVALLGSLATPLIAPAGVMRPWGGTIAMGAIPPASHAGIDPIEAARASQSASIHEAGTRGLRTSSSRPEVTPVDSAGPAATRDSHAGANTVDTPPAAGRSPVMWTWPAALVGPWLSIGVCLGLRHFVRRYQLFARLGRREAVTDAAISGMFTDLCAAAGLRRAVRLTTSPACPVPMALTSREVCVPVRFLHALDAEQQRGALAHEVAHVARRDPNWLTVDALIGALFFFQPLNIVARRALRERAEWQCDDWAARQGAALGLARCLADVAGWLRPFPRHLLAVTVPMAARRSDLVQRVERLLNDAARIRPRAQSRVLVAASLTTVAVIWAAPAFSAAAPAVPGRLLVVGETAAPPDPPAVERVALTPPQQAQILQAPRAGDPLGERWAWALQDARARSLRTYWLGYRFAYPVRPREMHLSDSEGIDIDGIAWKGTPVGETLGVGVNDGIVVLVRYAGGTPAVNRVTHRSVNAPMDFAGAPVYWLGAAEDTDSVPWLDALQRAVRTTALRTELVEALSMHRSSSIVLPVLERLLKSEPDKTIRAEAAEGLEHHPVQPALRLAHETATTDSDAAVRAEAAEAIGEMQMEGAADALVDLANTSEDPGVRGEAAEALGAQSLESALRGIEQVVFNGSHEDARGEAVEAIGDLEGAPALALLRRIIWEHPSTRTRVEAVETIGDLKGIDAVGELREILDRHPDASARHEALDVLSDVRTPASFNTILEIATSGAAADVRRDAIEALGDAVKKGASGAEIDRAATALEHAIFNDPDEGVQVEAVEALHHFPRQRARAILERVVNTHPSRKVRSEAGDVMEQIGQD